MYIYKCVDKIAIFAPEIINEVKPQKINVRDYEED